MNILYQFNEKYAPYAGVSMTSLLENNKSAESICIYVLGEGLSEGSINRLKELTTKYKREIKFIDTSSLVEKMRELNMPTYRDSYAANMRLFVSDIIKDDIDRLIYLDADTIVTGSLDELYNEDIKTVGMVYDTLGCDHKYSIGLNKEDGYYNSGVILYDVKKWINNDFTKKIIEHVTNVRAQYPSPDQDLLNVVLREEITPIDIRYNYQPHLRDYSYDSFMKVFNPYPFYSKDSVSKADTNPVIMHAFRYLGEFPWHRKSLHPFVKEFDSYLALSPWKDYVKEASNGGLVMDVERLLYQLLPKFIFIRIFRIMHGRFYKKADKLSMNNKISSQM